MFSKQGKLGLVDLGGVRSTHEMNTPRIKKDLNKNFNNFSFLGEIEGKPCLFRIDTGSDVTILNSKLAEGVKINKIRDFNLRYPTGEKVPIKFQADVKLRIGKYFRKIPMLIANITDDCLLGTDFLKELKLDEIIGSLLGFAETGKRCSRIENSSEEVPSILKELYEESSENLSEAQRGELRSLFERIQRCFFKGNYCRKL